MEQSVKKRCWREDTATGPENAALRKLARSAIEFAQRVRHSPTSTRRDAGAVLNVGKDAFRTMRAGGVNARSC